MKLGGSLGRHRKARPARRGERSAGGRPSGSPWRKTAVWALALAALGWGSGYLVATRLLFPAPPPPAGLVAVPDLRGRTVVEGEALLLGAGLVLGGVDSLLHPSLPRGLILGQSPLPGQLALGGTEVRVTRSLGPQTRAVPDVRNVSAARALVVLQTIGLQVVVDSVESEVPRGRVVATRPEGGAVVPLPSEVLMSVSLGPPQVLMPYLLGLAEPEALALLDSLGLVVGTLEEVEREGRDSGIVVDQHPPADTPVERGSAVRLAVGRRGG